MTILFYNRPKIFKYANGKPKEIIRIFDMLTYNKVPDSFRDPIARYATVDFVGMSFMLHPDVLLFNSYKYSNYDVAAYILIAAARQFTDYSLNGTTTLALKDSPVDPREYLENEELITVENGVLHFLYEQTPHISQQH